MQQDSVRGVVTFTPADFDAACRRLLDIASRFGDPDLVVGIHSGGWHVARAMARALPAATPVLGVTCRRPGTSAKQRMPLLRPVLRCLPRFASDTLRRLEHHLVTARRRPETRRALVLDQVELMALAAELAVWPQARRLLVVDDAVDSGVTLDCVLRALHDLVPARVRVESAVITVTTPAPAVLPDYTLYRGALCRFPWSMDAAIA